MSQNTNFLEVLTVSIVRLNIVGNINEIRENKSPILNIIGINITKSDIIDKCNRKKCKLCDAGDYKKCYNKSFISHPRAKFWSKDNLISARDVAKNSHRTYKFNCGDCFHTFDAIPNVITSKNQWCPYSSYPPQKLCSDEGCIRCYTKSFASSEKAKYWSDKNIKKPRDVFKSSNKKYIFNCNECPHEFLASLKEITINNQWCPYSAIPSKIVCDDEKCIYCYNKSFASSKWSKYWSDKNIKKPRYVFKSENSSKYLFDCPFCEDEYESTLNNISNGNWCDCIVNKTEIILYNWLKNNYNYNFDIEKQKKFEWCKNIRCLPFDFCIDELKLLIELDGRQHFEQVSNWISPEENQKIDKHKMNLANDNGYSIIRIYQPHVWNNKNSWEINLRNAVKSYNIVTNIFIGEIYKQFPIYS